MGSASILYFSNTRTKTSIEVYLIIKMSFHHCLLKRLIFCTLIVLQLNLCIVDAKCKGSVVFFWKETRADRLDTKRNWGVLEKEIKGNRSKLSVYMDTDNTYAFK